MPQWDFLNFLAKRAARYPAFKLIMQAEVTGLVEEAGHVAGFHASTPEGRLEILADLVIGADGRHSVVRAQAGLKVREFGAPMDVLWFRLSRQPGDSNETMGRFGVGRILVMINRGAYWQCGYVIPKGSFEQIRERGLQSFREVLARIAPFERNRFTELQDWEAVKLLTVRVDRLDQWHRSGLLLIGDAAHAMSPIGRVGINLAIQDAVAAANVLADPLRTGRLSAGHLSIIQQRREMPTRATQWMQLLIQNRVFKRVLGGTDLVRSSRSISLISRFPFLNRIVGRLIGMGFRPEHIRIPDVWLDTT